MMNTHFDKLPVGPDSSSARSQYCTGIAEVRVQILLIAVITATTTINVGQYQWKLYNNIDNNNSGSVVSYDK